MPSESQLESEIDELERQIATINRFLRRAPWLGLSVLVAIPIWLRYGDMAGGVAAITAATCTAIAMYIPAMHRLEHRRRLQELRPTRM
jgi:hypothetical protein